MLLRVKFSRICQRSRDGFTMIELMVVIVISIILLGVAAFAVSENTKRSNREAVVTTLQSMSTAISDAYYDIGAPNMNVTADGAIDDFKRYLNVLSEDYLGIVFDESTITPLSSGKGYSVSTLSPFDVYDAPYYFWFITDKETMKYVMVASGGENGNIDSDKYTAMSYADDIVMIVRPKE